MKRILSLWLPNWPHPNTAAGAPRDLAATNAPLGGATAGSRSVGNALRGVPDVPKNPADGEERSGATGKPSVHERSRKSVGSERHGGRSLQRAQGGALSLPKLARWCERYSPLVGFADSNDSPDLLLDITGIGPLFGGEDKLAAQLTSELAALGYLAQVAVADTIGAAWALNHFSSFSLQPSAFTHLPVESLRLPAETVDLLHQLGVFRIEELLRLPRAALAARFADGPARRSSLLTRLDQATGAADEVLTPYRPPPEFQAERALEHPVEQREAVERILMDLAERVGRQLAPRRQGAVRLECRLDCAGNEPLLVEVGLFRPSAEPRYLLDLLQMRLAQQAWPGPIGRVGLHVTLAAPLADRQQNLFPDAAQEFSRHLALLIDRLSGRLGREAVLRPRLLPDAQPERACRYVPLAGNKESKSQTARRKGSGGRGQGSVGKVSVGNRPVGNALCGVPDAAIDTADGDDRPGPSGKQPPRKAVGPERHGGRYLQNAVRPLLVFPQPLPLEVNAVSPGGLPARFTHRQRTWQAARHWGPERIETGWWRGRSVRRDYYRVETEDGRRYWLFCRLDDGNWFLHGSFA